MNWEESHELLGAGTVNCYYLLFITVPSSEHLSWGPFPALSHFILTTAL